jgi:hypothetical protein
MENSSYFPLKVGNTWKFTVIDYRIPVNDTSEATFSIVGTKTIEQVEYFILKGGPKIFWPPIFMDRFLMGFDTLLLRKNELGHLMLRTPEGEVPYFIFDKSLINFHRQFYINKNKFEVVVVGIDNLHREMIVAGIDSTIRHFPREYQNCFHVGICMPQIMGTGVDSWFAPGIGMVFIHYHETNVDYILTEAYINDAWVPFP